MQLLSRYCEMPVGMGQNGTTTRFYTETQCRDLGTILTISYTFCYYLWYITGNWEI